MNYTYVYQLDFEDGMSYIGSRYKYGLDSIANDNYYKGSSKYLPTDVELVEKRIHQFWAYETEDEYKEAKAVAVDYEAKLHKLYDVKSNPRFYNKSNQTSSGFATCLRGEDNPRFGNTHSEEAKAKISVACKGKILSDKTRAKMSISKSDSNNPLFGCLPWDNPRAQPSDIKELWSLLPQVYGWWLEHNHKKRGSGCSAAAKYFGYKHSQTWWNMIKYCRKYPNGSWWGSDDYEDWLYKFIGDNN